jgi:hypothetical protein
MKFFHLRLSFEHLILTCHKTSLWQRGNSLSFLFPAEGDINDVLIKTLAEAHANTNIKLEVVHEMFRKPQVGCPGGWKSREGAKF